MNADAYKYIRYNASQETRWATVEELQRSCAHISLNDDDYPAAGIPLMADNTDAYVDDKDTHTLIFGATGSKKTRLFCMPMINIMAKAGESFIVTDPKGELYAQTSGLVAKKGYKTVVLNFRDIGKGDTWNPLSIPYEMWKKGYKDEAGALLSDIAATFAGPITQNNKDSYWPEAAQELAIASFYLLMEAAEKEEVNMKSFAHISSTGSIKNIKRLAKMMREDCVAAINYSNTACLDANNTVAGIVGTLHGMLRLFTVNDKLTQMLSKSSFDMRKFGREKTAVYIIVPDEKTTYHFLVTMFLKQTYEIMITEAQKEKDRQLPVRVNFVLDEFCNIPKIPDMPSMISAARSRNMRYYLVAQSLHQLKSRYGYDADTIKGNCDNWIFLTSKELELLNEISELCGSIVTPEGQSRRLISPSELQRFDKAKGEALIIHARQYPIISEMPDISEYEMFGLYEPVELEEFEKKDIPCMSLNKLLYAIDNLEMKAPFTSEDYMLYQAITILERELSGVEDSDDGDSEVDEDIQELINSIFAENPVENNTESETERAKQEAERIEEEKRKEEKTLAAIFIARKKVAALLGEEFAYRYFEGDLKGATPKQSYGKSYWD